MWVIGKCGVWTWPSCQVFESVSVHWPEMDVVVEVGGYGYLCRRGIIPKLEPEKAVAAPHLRGYVYGNNNFYL